MAEIINDMPSGVQTFEEIINKRGVYVDKTNYLAKMLSSLTKAWFLARPRRFGKSLTLSTLTSVFSDEEKLFKGLAIEPRLSETFFAPRPVIMLDMSAGATSMGGEEYMRSLCKTTLRVAFQLGVEVPPDNSPSAILGDLIVRYHHKTGQKMAVLIDEYDNPLLDFMSKPDEMEKVRLILRDYYRQLKVFDRLISFIFITGITKSAVTGLFSGFNSFTDISARPGFGAICGFTHDELGSFFGDHLRIAAKRLGLEVDKLLGELRRYYDGFCFDGRTRLYNPFSILKFFDSEDFLFGNYWFESGGSNHLAQYMKDKELTVEQFRGMTISRQRVLNPNDLSTTTPDGLLHQAGYLSLRPGNDPDIFTLDYSNLEVYGAMSRLLTARYLGFVDADKALAEIRAAARSGDVDMVVGWFNRFYAKIPYDFFGGAVRSEINLLFPEHKLNEWVYRGYLLSLLVGTFFDVDAEVHGSLGRSDLVVKVAETTWVIELKVFRKEGDDGTAKADEAFAQILAKRYAERYDGRRVLLGIAIDDNVRAITAWKYQAGQSVPQIRTVAGTNPETETAPKPKRRRKPKP